MAMGAGMTSAIMNPIALPLTEKKILGKITELEKLGVIVPDGIDYETFCRAMGIGSTRATAGSEMTAIRAANFLTNNDPNGAKWIKYNKPISISGEFNEGRRSTGRRRSK